MKNDWEQHEIAEPTTEKERKLRMPTNGEMYH